MKKVDLTCIECPIGCQISVEINDGKIVSVIGNTCPRGEKYAKDEVVCPKRVLTTTVKLTDGRMLPVKTNLPIEKSQIFNAMKRVNEITVKAPIKIGEVIVKDFYAGVDLISCLEVF